MLFQGTLMEGGAFMVGAQNILCLKTVSITWFSHLNRAWYTITTITVTGDQK